ncbi:hypothetical protein [Sporosarcina sp. P29]|uniref:hypothetical protein n=1 Tax=Sporosarcina sp. P29 TaxID=2048252 RepID=UPI000C167712|nr:hypothetical protein [Sporosarcina sp. P29]PIC99882.1 hypothetical protein CSV68_05330 [Sporosarcina sp. P29]
MNKQLKIFFITSLSIIVFGGIFIVYHFQTKGYEWVIGGGDKTLENPYDDNSPNSELLIEGEEPKDDKGNGQKTDGSSNKGSKNTESQQGTDGSSSNGINEGTTTSGSNTTGNSTGTKGSNPSPNNQTNNGKQPSSENQTTSTGQSSTGGTTSDKSATGNTQTGNSDDKKSVAQIKSKYKPTINKLQEEVDSELNTLVSRAKKDYSTKKANGESIDYGYFYNKYMSSIAGLEAQTDAEFNGIMSSLERDLQANGHNKSSSQSIRDEYEAQKNARRNSMQSEIMGN